MAIIIRRQPTVRAITQVALSVGQVVVLRPRQIILWVTIAAPEERQLASDARRFPAVLDTGFNGGFLIQQQHLVDWAGIQPADLEWIDSIRVFDRDVRMREANVWLHSDGLVPQTQTEGAPVCLELDQGIGVCPADLNRPRLPLVGMHAIERNGLEVLIDGRRQSFSIRQSLPRPE